MSEFDVCIATMPAPDTRGREEILLDELADLLPDDPASQRAGILAAQRLAALYGSEAVFELVESMVETGNPVLVSWVMQRGLRDMTRTDAARICGCDPKTISRQMDKFVR